MKYPSRITIREVSPRDGLQGEPEFVPTPVKVRLIAELVRAGFSRINATSFASPKAIPQMADADEVAAQLPASDSVLYDATVPNARGAARAIAAGFRAITVFVSASDAGSRANVGKGTIEAMAEASRSIDVAREVGATVVGTVSKAFGSPYGEEITSDAVLGIIAGYLESGVSSVALGDTSGEANPDQVHRLVAEISAEHPDLELAMHFHDTRGLALANTLAAMDAGVTHFDSAVGGIGGSPFTRNAAGNLATEDLLFMCHSMGIETGIDLGAVLDAYEIIHDQLGRELPAKLSRLDRADAELAR